MDDGEAHPLRLRGFRLMFIGRSLSTVDEAVLPAALSISVVRLTGSAAALGATLACTLPTVSALVAGTVTGPARQQPNSLMAAARSAAMPFGPSLSGLLILTAGTGWVFALDAAMFAASAALLSVISVAHQLLPRRSLRAGLAEGWSEVVSRDWYWSSLIAHGIWNFAGGVPLTLGAVDRDPAPRRRGGLDRGAAGRRDRAAGGFVAGQPGAAAPASAGGQPEPGRLVGPTGAVRFRLGRVEPGRAAALRRRPGRRVLPRHGCGAGGAEPSHRGRNRRTTRASR